MAYRTGYSLKVSPACRAADVGEADVYAISESGILPIGKLSDIENIEL